MKDFLEIKNSIAEIKSPMDVLSSKIDYVRALIYPPTSSSEFLFLHIFANT